MMYMVNATQPASTDGFSATVPTAEGLTAGTYYVWYYVKADDSHTDSEISASGIEVTIASAYTMAAAATSADKGKLICTDGHIHAYGEDAECTKDRVALICYVGNDAETSTTYNHGLALALADVSETKKWCNQTGENCLGAGRQFSSTDDAKTDMAGIDNTDVLAGSLSHNHDAAIAARNYNSGTYPDGTSAWFLPSVGQWDKMIGTGGYGLTNLKTDANGYTGLQENVYCSSTESNASNAWVFLSSSGNLDGSSKDNNRRVRACLAF